MNVLVYIPDLKKFDRIKLRYMSVVLVITCLLALLKFVAYWLTNSNAILTDALESLINIAAGAFALFSIYYSALPRDENHPYGHGKIEFISAGFEGGLILIAGLAMIAKAIYGFIEPHKLEQLNAGMLITAFGGVVNWIMGRLLVKKGESFDSLTLTADGKHLLTDTYSSVALVIGLGIIYFTGLHWLDNVLTIVFGLFILFTGYRLIRSGVAGLLDETDFQTLEAIIEILNAHRREKWIDIHNLRVQKYGSRLHIDCHLTLPWYDQLEEVHKEVEALEYLVNDQLSNRVELFVHADPCRPTSCPICEVQNCPVRQYEFKEKINWKLENLLPNRQHNR